MSTSANKSPGPKEPDDLEFVLGYVCRDFEYLTNNCGVEPDDLMRTIREAVAGVKKNLATRAETAAQLRRYVKTASRQRIPSSRSVERFDVHVHGGGAEGAAIPRFTAYGCPRKDAGRCSVVRVPKPGDTVVPHCAVGGEDCTELSVR